MIQLYIKMAQRSVYRIHLQLAVYPPPHTYPNLTRTKHLDRISPSHQSQPITKISAIRGSDYRHSIHKRPHAADVIRIRLMFLQRPLLRNRLAIHQQNLDMAQNRLFRRRQRLFQR